MAIKKSVICFIERGGLPRPIYQFITDDEKGIDWIKIGDATESMYIMETAQKIKPEGMTKSRYVQHGDFLLSNSIVNDLGNASINGKLTERTQ